MTEQEFEEILEITVARLGEEIRASTKYHDPKAFETRTCEVLEEVAQGRGIAIKPTWHQHAFPDIKANGFGVEVKTTTKDSWLSVGNSVFEGMRDQSVSKIYVVFAKLGGMPGVKWGRYEERITHVRISHAPRFVIEMDRDSSLFGHMKVGYDEFAKLPPADKMRHIREYSRGRLQSGERLWWLEDESGPGVPVEIKLYMHLTKEEKTKLRAEGALLCPEIVGSGRKSDKYNEVAFYFLRYRNVFCPQTRDLYTAGSVVGQVRGGNRILRSLKAIETEMREAAMTLPSELVEEYWEESVAPEQRIAEWLTRADKVAKGWKPSKELFLPH